MYLDHFGFHALPFAESAGPEGFVPLAGHEAALRRLRYGIEVGCGPVVLVGPPGTGKTRLAGVAGTDGHGRTIFLDAPWLSGAGLLELIVGELGGGSTAAPARWLRERLAAETASGNRTMVVVDEAHLIADPSIFEGLRSLQNFASAGPPDLSLALVGDLALLLRIPDGLMERVTARVVLEPFLEPESLEYLAGRIVRAGGDGELLDPGVGRLLHRSASGLARRLNRLADLTLLIAFAEGLPRPDERCARLAIGEIGYAERVA